MLSKIKWFWKYYRRYPYILAVLLFLTPVQAFFTASIPRMFGYAIDYLQTGENPKGFLADQVINWGAWMGLSTGSAFGWGFIVLGILATTFYAFVQCHRAWMNLKLQLLFRQDAFDNATTKGPDFYNRFRTGDLVTRMTDDVAEKLSWFACSGIFRFWEAIVNVTFILAMMITINPRLTLWTAGPLPILILIYFLFSSALDRRYDHLQTRISRFNDIIEACFSGIRVIIAYVRENAQQVLFHKSAEERRRAEISAVRITAVVDSLWHYIWQFSIVVVLIAGGYMAINGELSYGSFAAFIYYVVWLVFPMFDIGQFLVKGRQSAVSINRLLELEKVPPMVVNRADAHINGDKPGNLRFDAVEFGFPDSRRKILDGISFEINSGQTVALVGRVGSGKTWLINMIPRLVDPTGGKIELDGHDLRQFDIDDLRRNIGYVPQEPVLFSDSVRNNILFGREDISETVLKWAIDVAQLKSEIESFPRGIDTPIGTRGMSISGGQKQRLALARALVGKPKILILDDCTSALDSRTETALWERLQEVMPEMTAILITHRPDTLERADNIFVIDNGKLVQEGRHAGLIATKGLYASIYRRYQLEQQVNK